MEFCISSALNFLLCMRGPKKRTSLRRFARLFPEYPLCAWKRTGYKPSMVGLRGAHRRYSACAKADVESLPDNMLLRNPCLPQSDVLRHKVRIRNKY